MKLLRTLWALVLALTLGFAVQAQQTYKNLIVSNLITTTINGYNADSVLTNSAAEVATVFVQNLQTLLSDSSPSVAKLAYVLNDDSNGDATRGTYRYDPTLSGPETATVWMCQDKGGNTSSLGRWVRMSAGDNYQMSVDTLDDALAVSPAYLAASLNPTNSFKLTVKTRARKTLGDGGAASYYYSATAPASTNSGAVVPYGSGYLVWDKAGQLTPEMFGAVPYNVAYSPYVGEAYSPALPGTGDFTIWADWYVPTYSSDTSIACSLARLSGGQDGLVENSFEVFGATNYFALLVRNSSGSSSTGAGAGQFVGANPFLAYQGTRIQTAFVRTNGSFKVYRGTNDITSGFSATNPGQLAASIGNGETTGVLATSSINANLPRSPIFALKFFTNALTLSQIAAASTATNYVATVSSPNLETSLTNSGPAIQAAIDYAAESGIATVQLSGGYYLTSDQINLRPGVNLLGFGSSSWNGNRSAASAPTKIGLTFDSTATNVVRVDRAFADFAQVNLNGVAGDGSYVTNYYFGGSVRHLWLDASPSKYGIPFELYKVSNYQVEDVVAQQYYGAMFRVWAGNALDLRKIYAAPSLGGLRGGLVLGTADIHITGCDYGGTDGVGLLLHSSGKNQLTGNFIWNQVAASGALTAPTVNTATDTFAATGHNYFTGMPVRFLANGGTLPSPLDESVMYWAIRVDADTVAVNPQYDQGAAGGALQGVKLNLTTAGSGSWVMRPYTRFDGNVVIASSSSVRIDGGRFDQAFNSGLVLDDCFSVAVSANFTEAGHNGSSSTPGIIIAGGSTNSIVNSQLGKTRSASAADIGVLLTNTVANIVRNNTYYNLTTPISASSLTALAAPDVLTVQGDFVIGTAAALATTATNGFIALPTTAGTPTGTPTDYGDVAPTVVDSTNHRLYTHDGAWRHAPLWPTAGAATVSANSVLTLTPDAGYTPLVTKAEINGNAAELYNANSTLPGVRIMAYAANGSSASPSQVTAGQTIFDLQPAPRHNSSGYNSGYVRLRALATENQTSSAAGAYWLFGATVSGTSVTNVLAVQGNGIDVTGRTETDTIELGNASDTTLARSAAGKITVEGNEVPSPASPSTGQIIVYTNSAWTAMTPGASGIGGSTGSTDNKLLRSDGTGGATLQNSAVTIDDYTSSTANNVAIKVDDGSTANISAVITPKGTGAFILGPKPDGTTTGGNARGSYAVDFQVIRANAARVASGAYSFMAGTENLVSGSAAAAIGNNNSASGANSFATGYISTASGAGAFASGYASTASGDYSQGTGRASTSDKTGQWSVAGAGFAAAGDAQTSIITLRNSTSSTTPTVLFTDGSSATLTIPNNNFWTFTVLVSGTTATATSERYAYKLEGCIGKGTTAGSTSMPAAVTKTVIYEANAAADVTATADTTNGALTITVTAANATATRWSASVMWNQVAYP